ncbi:hypothetical protein ABB37_09872 [Leptomonas pyrrhocoris]|uniref:Uncharacterized protein n=1 Tax=Leptomonas pyrrhocoris TaxID=157538 RepID=A0A0N0VCR0_LEPPY|nr:hypothetical protein ABB37_09872 [Leptomonas pyrrhocoris]KPA73428.1 hypothetical protein ABB37_09872 [Leptomonas pyrrhocoris]|eukprot:XP_015651867.1 hypothetical protein ABB37_09872 [Leptomonas pyrrhocoris]
MSADAARADAPISGTTTPSSPPPLQSTTEGEGASAQDVPPLPAAPMKRRRSASSAAKRHQPPPPSAPAASHKTKRAAASTTSSPPHYLAPTAAAAARRRRPGTTLHTASNAEASRTATSQASGISLAVGGGATAHTWAPRTSKHEVIPTTAVDVEVGADTPCPRAPPPSSPSSPAPSAAQPPIPARASDVHASYVEEVLEAQLGPPALPFASTTAAAAATPTLIDVVELKPQARSKVIAGTSGSASRTAGRLQRRQQQKTERVDALFFSAPAHAAAAPSSSPSPARAALDITSEAAAAAAADESDDDDPAELHTTLHLQPFPPTIAASAKVAAALADVLGSTGVDGELTEALLEPARPAQTAAQAALAVARADLLYDSLDGTGVSGHVFSASLGCAGQPQHQREEDARERIWSAGPGTSPSLAPASPARQTRHIIGATSFTPAVIAEFLKIEADAEAAAMQQKAQPRAVSSVKERSGTPAETSEVEVPPPPSSSPPPLTSSSPSAAPADSAAVLRELQVMQQRLHSHGYRRIPVKVSPLKVRRQHLQQQQQQGYSSSPCDISASSASDASSSSSDSAKAAAEMAMSARRRARRGTVDWTTASVTEIVEALDRASSPSVRLQRQRRKHHGGGTTSAGRRRGAAADFDPEMYVHALLEGRATDDGDDDDDALSSCPSLVSSELLSDAADVDAWAGPDTVASSPPPAAAAAAEPPLSSPTPQELRREALLRAGPSWAAAAAEVGLTPGEVRELLRYSLSAPEAAAWLSGSTDHTDHPPSRASPPHRGTDGEGGQQQRDAEADDDEDETHHQRRHRQRQPVSYALDAATQTALVHRLLSALPAVPAALKDEMDRQRRLLERVCQEVRIAAAPVHAAVRDRLASPTATSFARQPALVELHTYGDDNDGGGGGDDDAHAGATPRNSTSTRKEQERDRAYDAQLLASLPRRDAQSLSAVAGLHRAAADPTRALPPFHTVIAPPPSALRASGGRTGSFEATSTSPPPPQQQLPYEAALHELAERETRHYVSELDRLRGAYDRQLAEERRQRGLERQQYAALLEGQQQKMLRHHRETIHLLQRDARLQQQQQDSLVQQLATAQAATAQRQQGEHERTTRRMLSGVVEAMKSHCVTAAAMDACVGAQRRQSESLSARGRARSSAMSLAGAAAAKVARARRIHQRTDAAAAAEAKGAPPPTSSAVSTSKEASTDDTTKAIPAELAERVAAVSAAPHENPSQGPRPLLRFEEPEEETATLPHESIRNSEEAPPQQQPFDADIPTVGHLTPLRRRGRPSAAASSSFTDSEPHSPISTRAGSPEKAIAASTSAATSNSATAAATAEDTHRSPPPPSPSLAPALQLNNAEVLRAVYGTAPPQNVSHHHSDTSTSVGVHHDGPSAAPQPRMTLPLHAHLPPEDEFDAHVRRVEAAKAAVDTRASAAAQNAGLAAGVKLYVIDGPTPLRRQLARKHGAVGKAPNAVTRSGTAPAGGGRVRPSSPSPAAASGFAASSRQRSRTAPGGARSRQSQRQKQQRSRKAAAAAVAASPSGRRFDMEVVAALASETGPTYAPYRSTPSSLIPQGGYDPRYSHNPYTSPYLPPPLQQQPSSLYRGAWVEGMPTHAETAARADAGTIAGRPCVGPPVLVLGEPVVRAGTGHVHTAAVAAATYTQVLNARLHAAQHQRERDVAELRKATEQREAERTMPPAVNGGAVAGAGPSSSSSHSPPPTPPPKTPSSLPSPSADDAAEHHARVGALPPCDANFFGAPADVMTTADDDDGDSRGRKPNLIPLPSASPSPCAGPMNRSGREGPTDALNDLRGPSRAAAAVLMSASSSPSWTTDYARAWGRLETAAREVESAAAALAAEDAGVLEAVAREHHRRGGPPPPPPPSTSSTAAVPHSSAAIQLPRHASASAAVRYREQQLGDWAGREKQEGGEGERGGVYVSAKMADQARALTLARHRLARIRACFAAPPSLHAGAAALVGGAASTPRLSARTASSAGGHGDAAWVRRVVDETVLSLFEAAGNAQRDPVRQVVAAMEHELLRLVLQEHLSAEAEAQQHPPTSTSTDGAPQAHAAAASAARNHTKKAKSATCAEVDLQLLHAVVEAALEEAVQAALHRRIISAEDSPRPPLSHTASASDPSREAVARAVRRFAEGSTDRPASIDVAVPNDDEAQRERVALPLRPSMAWLHDAPGAAAAAADVVVPSPADAHPPSPTLSSSGKKRGGEQRDAPLATATIVVPLQSTASSVATAAAAALPPPHELRLVLDLSPVAHHLLSPPGTAATTAAPLQRQWSSRRLPPMQQEELPSSRMQLEDRRDVIVEAEIRRTTKEQKEIKEGAASASVEGGAGEELRLLLPALPPPPSMGGVGGEKRRSHGEQREGDDDDATAELLRLPPPPPPPSLPPPAPLSHAVGIPVLTVPPPQPLSAAPVAAATTGLTSTFPVAAAAPAPPPPTFPTPFAIAEAGARTAAALPAALPPPQPHAVEWTSTARAAASTNAVFCVLLSNFVDQEATQRTAIADREEEQRQSLLQLLVVVTQQNLREGPRRGAAASTAVTDQRREHSAAAAALPSLAHGAAHLSSPAPPSLSRVRDPVMSAVLEWVYQFGSSQKILRQQQRNAGRAATTTASALVNQLESAAVTAAVQSPADALLNVDDAHWLDGYVGRSDTLAYSPEQYRGHPQRQPPTSASQSSTRNFGSDRPSAAIVTATSSSGGSSSPSLPSSLHTNSSSSSSASLTETRWGNRVEPVARHERVSAARARPVLDAQHLPYRRAAAAERAAARQQPQAAANARTGSGSSDTATTRYTTTTTAASSSYSRDSEKGRSKPKKKRNAPPQQQQQREDERSSHAAVMSSGVLPQRVSAEVREALAAALRAHRRSATADIYGAEPPPQQQSRGERNPMLSWNGMADTSAAACGPDSSQYAVTLPARSAESTLLRSPPSLLPHASHERRSPTRDPRRQPFYPPKRSPATEPASANRHHRSGGPPTRPSEQWDAYSLTSTSTSTQSTDRRDSRSGRQRSGGETARQQEGVGRAPASAAQTIARPTATSALPFLSGKDGADVAAAAAASINTATAPSQLPPSSTRPARTQTSESHAPLRAAPLMSPSSPPRTAALQEEVVRVQQEQRRGWMQAPIGESLLS